MNKSISEYLTSENKKGLKETPSHRPFNGISKDGFNFTAYTQEGIKLDEDKATKQLEAHVKKLGITTKGVEILNSGKGKGSETEYYVRFGVSLK